MVEDIDELVNNDFCAEMELKSIPNSRPYTKKEVEEMVHIIGKVYSISHCITCTACGRKFVVATFKENEKQKNKK